LPDCDPQDYGGFSEGSDAHLQQQFNVTQGFDSQPVQGERARPFCGTCGSTAIFTPGNNVPLSVEHCYSIPTTLDSDIDYDMHLIRDTAFTQIYDGPQDIMNSIDAPFPSNLPQSVDLSAEVRDLGTEFCVDTQLFPFSFPSDQPHSIWNSNQHALGLPFTMDANHNDPSSTASTSTTDDGANVSETQQSSPSSPVDSTKETRPIPQHHSIPCYVCERRFSCEERLVNHQRVKHAKYTCDVSGCTTSTTSRGGLTRHHKSVHTPRVRLLCGKVLGNREYNILRHAENCTSCSPRIGEVNRMLGIEGVRKRGRKRKNP